MPTIIHIDNNAINLEQLTYCSFENNMATFHFTNSIVQKRADVNTKSEKDGAAGVSARSRRKKEQICRKIP